MREGVGREMKMDAVGSQAVDAVADTAYIGHVEVEVEVVNGMFATGIVNAVGLVFAGDGVKVTTVFGCVDGVDRLNIAMCCGPWQSDVQAL